MRLENGIFALFTSEDTYREKVEEQKNELRKLMEERKRLLGVQEQLQKLYEHLPSVSDCQKYSRLCITRTAWDQKKCSSYKEFRVRRCFLNGKRREGLRELYEFWDNSSYNCSSYAEFTVST